MKKILFTSLFSLISLLLLPSCWAESAHQQQGFESFQEREGGKIAFSCKGQCIYMLGAYNRWYDYISFSLSAKWQGKVGYGFVNGQQIVPGEVVASENRDRKFAFSKLPYISQVPDWMPIVMFLEGQMSGEMSWELKRNTFGESMQNAWDEFWTFDSFRPYSINLLYGPRVGGTSVNGTFFLLFILFSAIVAFVLFLRGNKKQISAVIILIWGVLWAVYDIRMTMEINGYYLEDYRNYVSKSAETRVFRDRGDFYDFMDFAQKSLSEWNPENKKRVAFFTDNEWPFYGSATYFLLPSMLEKQTKDTDILVFYWYGNVRKAWNTLSLSWETIGSGTIIPFSNQAFIFIRK